MLKNRIEMRDHSAEGRLFFRRTLVAYIGMIVLMLVLLGNLYYLQVESYDTYQTRSNDNRIRVVPVAPPRGSSMTPTACCWRRTARFTVWR